MSFLAYASFFLWSYYVYRVLMWDNNPTDDRWFGCFLIWAIGVSSLLGLAKMFI